MEGNYLKQVRDQYEDYPYPYRDPQDEKKRLVNTALDGLAYLNHHVYGGKKDFKNNFNVLIAGGGTGDSLVYLAEQLREIPNATVTYLDLSTASMAIAQERAKVRGLTNIDWHHMSLLDVAKIGKKFDYINCSGVLHHLESPDAGLKALAGVLKPDGAIGIMVYAQYGRTAIYQMQDLMRLINEPDTPAAEKVARTKSVMSQLPPDNLFRQQSNIWQAEIQRNGDIGIYDLLLHSTDRAYTVPELYEWTAKVGLKVGRFSGLLGYGLVYRPEFVFGRDPEVMALINEKDLSIQQAIAELAHSNIARHIFYACRDEVARPSVDETDMVPFFHMQFLHGPELAKQVMPDQPLALQTPASGLRITLPYSPYLKDVLHHLDGQNTFGEILAAVSKAHPASAKEDIRSVLAHLYDRLEDGDMMLCRHKSVPAFEAERNLQLRVA